MSAMGSVLKRLNTINLFVGFILQRKTYLSCAYTGMTAWSIKEEIEGVFFSGREK